MLAAARLHDLVGPRREGAGECEIIRTPPAHAAATLIGKVQTVSRIRQLLTAGVVLFVLGLTVALLVIFTGPDDGEVANPTTTTSSPDSVLRESLPGSNELRTGDLPGARVAILAHLDQNPEDLRARYLLALTYEREGDSEGAIRAYQDIIQTDARNFEAYFRMGLLQREADRAADAAVSFSKALELNDDFTAARVALAEVRAGMGETDDAIKLYFQVIEEPPLGIQLDQVRTDLAALLVKAGQPDNAVLQLQRALAENPSNLEARRLLDTVRPGTPTFASTTTTVEPEE